MDGKKTEEKAIFLTYSRGLSTGRDIWAYGSSQVAVNKNIDRMFDAYNRQARDFDEDRSNFEFIRDDRVIRWNRTLENYLNRGARNLRNLFTGALSERLDNKKLVFELNEGSLNLRIF